LLNGREEKEVPHAEIRLLTRLNTIGTPVTGVWGLEKA